MLAPKLEPIAVEEKPQIKAVSREDELFAELKALPDAPHKRRRARVAKKLTQRLDFVTYAAYRRACEIHAELDSIA